jgi:hypothetical protein
LQGHTGDKTTFYKQPLTAAVAMAACSTPTVVFAQNAEQRESWSMTHSTPTS